MARMSLTWTLEHHGWARCVVADAQSEAVAIASYVTGGPEYLLTAVARLALGADRTSAEFEAEPDVWWAPVRRSVPEGRDSRASVGQGTGRPSAVCGGPRSAVADAQRVR